MYRFRPIILEDIPVLTHQRKQMFLDMGRPDDAKMRVMLEAFVPWVKSAMIQGTYTGFLALHAAKVAAGLGLMFQEMPPSLRDLGSSWGYILNVYTEPEHRRKGLAGELVKFALQECKGRGIHTVRLYASEMGHHLYASLGFKPREEMIRSEL
jgi:GNAT superfamily N-acetyltransferase